MTNYLYPPKKSVIARSNIFLNKFNDVFYKINDNYVWSEKTGYGLWNNGIGLVSLYQRLNNKKRSIYEPY